MGQEQKVSVAQFVKNFVSHGSNSRSEIAARLGLSSQVLQRFEDGTMKVPVNLAKPLAEAMGADPADFIETVFGEYMPETWAVVKDWLGSRYLNEREMEVIEAYRTMVADGVANDGIYMFPSLKSMHISWQR